MKPLEPVLEKMRDFRSKLALLKESHERQMAEEQRLQLVLDNQTKARELIQVAANKTQQTIKEKIENIVSEALKAIPLKESYTFKVDFVSRRNVTECDLLFDRNGNSAEPLESCGYGASDIASFALRIAYWVLSSNLNNVIVVDEPFADLNKSNHPYAFEMIKRISDELKIQFILNTHETTIIENADRVFEVSLVKGVSKVKQK